MDKKGLDKAVEKVLTCYERLDLEIDDRVSDTVIDKFNRLYTCDVLNSLGPEEVLERMFSTATNGHNHLAYFLEFDEHANVCFGGIKGGSNYKYGLFQSKSDGKWKSNDFEKHNILTKEEAIKQGKKILGELNQANEIIKAYIHVGLTTIAQYEALEKQLENSIGSSALYIWRHKYFSMMYPEYFSVYHSEEWQKHVLYALGVIPSETCYGRSGQLNIIRKYSGLKSQTFHSVICNFFGKPKTFYRIGTSDDNKNMIEDLIAEKAIGIGWNDLGNLNNYVINKTINIDKLKKVLKDKYYSDSGNKGLPLIKAKEIKNFYNSDKDTIFVPANGQKIIGFANNIGEYYFDENKLLGHRKHCDWNLCFSKGEKLPNEKEGIYTTCHKIKEPENIVFLYDKYYFGKGSIQDKKQIFKHEEDDLKYIYYVNEESESSNTNYEDKPVKAQEAEVVKGIKHYKRDAKIGKYALKMSNYRCEMNPEHGTFISKSSGKSYLEPLIPISEQEYFKHSLDVPANVVALCSACHNEIHYGKDAELLIKHLYESRETRLKKAGINITIEELLGMYR